MDTGNTLKYMYKQLLAREPKSLKTVVLLHKVTHTHTERERETDTNTHTYTRTHVHTHTHTHDITLQVAWLV